MLHDRAGREHDGLRALHISLSVSTASQHNLIKKARAGHLPIRLRGLPTSVKLGTNSKDLFLLRQSLLIVGFFVSDNRRNVPIQILRIQLVFGQHLLLTHALRYEALVEKGHH